MGGYGWLGGSVGQWVGSGQIINNLINLDIIKIFNSLLFVETPPPMGGCMGSWVDGWFSGSVGGVRSYY